MYADSRKIQIIEAVLKMEDEITLSQVEKIIAQTPEKASAHNYTGILSKNDALLINKAIEEGCEQINSDDWK